MMHRRTVTRRTTVTTRTTDSFWTKEEVKRRANDRRDIAPWFAGAS